MNETKKPIHMRLTANSHLRTSHAVGTQTNFIEQNSQQSSAPVGLAARQQNTCCNPPSEEGAQTDDLT